MATKKTKTEEVAPVAEATAAATELVTTAPAGALTVVNADTNEFSSDQETLKADDLIIARWRCVQAMTRAKKHNKQLAEGQFYNTLTKKGLESALVVPIVELHHIVERTDDTQGKFVGTLALEDDRVRKARKANGQSLIKLKSTDRDPPTKFVETRDVHVAFLAEDGLTVTDFGVLQFDSTNLTPAKVWKNERNAISRQTPKGMPSYAFRTVVKTAVKDNSANGQNDSQIFELTAYQGNWKIGAIAFAWMNGETNSVSKAEYDLLKRLQEHKKLVESGVFKVDYEEETEVSEDDAEASSFDPDDDGREPDTNPNNEGHGSDDFS